MIKDLSDFKFTNYDNKRVDTVIRYQVMKIAERIFAEVKDIVALFLLGGYARGEGSVIIEPESIIPLGDYDFLVVTNFPHPSALNVTGLDFLQKRFRVQYHIGVDNVWKLRLPIVSRRIYWYEAKFGGKILFGDERVLNLINIHSGKEIDLDEGFSLIFNRLTGMLKHFDPGFLGSKLTEKQREHLIFQSIKGILACGESLQLLNGGYHFSYKNRCKRFLKSSKTDFRELAAADPDLLRDYEKATRFKLKPEFDMYKDAVGFWFTARRHLLNTVVYFLNKTLSRLECSARKANACTSLNDFPRFFLNRSKPQLLDFLVFNWRKLRHLKSLEGLRPRRHSFSDVIRASLFHLAHSISENGKIDEELLNEGLLTVSEVIPGAKDVMKENDLTEKWRRTRDVVFSAWTLCRA